MTTANRNLARRSACESRNSVRESSETPAATALHESNDSFDFEPVTSLGSTGLRHEVPVATVSEVLNRRESAPSRTPPVPAARLSRRVPKEYNHDPRLPVRALCPRLPGVGPTVRPEPRVAPPLGSLTLLPPMFPVEPSPVICRRDSSWRNERNRVAAIATCGTETIKRCWANIERRFKKMWNTRPTAIWPSVDAKALGKAFESLQRRISSSIHTDPP